MKDEIASFDIRYLDPLQRYEMHGMPTNSDELPTVKSTATVFNIMYLELAEEWIAEFMKDEVDEDTKKYVEALDYNTPNGIYRLVDINSVDELEAQHVVRIVTLMFTGSVWALV